MWPSSRWASDREQSSHAEAGTWWLPNDTIQKAHVVIRNTFRRRRLEHMGSTAPTFVRAHISASTRVAGTTTGGRVKHTSVQRPASNRGQRRSSGMGVAQEALITIEATANGSDPPSRGWTACHMCYERSIVADRPNRKRHRPSRHLMRQPGSGRSMRLHHRIVKRSRSTAAIPEVEHFSRR